MIVGYMIFGCVDLDDIRPFIPFKTNLCLAEGEPRLTEARIEGVSFDSPEIYSSEEAARLCIEFSEYRLNNGLEEMILQIVPVRKL